MLLHILAQNYMKLIDSNWSFLPSKTWNCFFIYCSAVCFGLSAVLQILLCVSLTCMRVYVCRGVYVYLYIRERKEGERDTEAERGRENNLPLYFWWWFISFPPLIFGFLLLYRMLPKHFHGIHCSYKLFMVALLPSPPTYPPTSSLILSLPGNKHGQRWQPTSCRSEQARLRRDAMCVEWVSDHHAYGDVARWQMMECSLWTHRLGKGLLSNLCLVIIWNRLPWGLWFIHISWDSAIKATLCGPNTHQERPRIAFSSGGNSYTCH